MVNILLTKMSLHYLNMFQFVLAISHFVRKKVSVAVLLV